VTLGLNLGHYECKADGDLMETDVTACSACIFLELKQPAMSWIRTEPSLSTTIDAAEDGFVLIASKDLRFHTRWANAPKHVAASSVSIVKTLREASYANRTKVLLQTAGVWKSMLYSLCLTNTQMALVPPSKKIVRL
jgi:hypothetical protein